MQIQSVIALTRNIVTRHRLDPHHVIAHSDMAPRRKIDPGEKFPWDRLAAHGLGLFVEPAPIRDGQVLHPGASGKAVKRARDQLRRLGFGLELGEDYDDALTFAVKGFQRHWRPSRVDGVFDPSTRETLTALLKTRGALTVSHSAISLQLIAIGLSGMASNGP